MDMPTTCLYASRLCTAPRSRKTNGALHRLCDEHRSKANAAQRRWHACQRPATTAAITTDTPSATATPRKRTNETQDDLQRQQRPRSRRAKEGQGAHEPGVIKWAHQALRMPVHAPGSYAATLSAASPAFVHAEEPTGRTVRAVYGYYPIGGASARIATVALAQGAEPTGRTALPHWVPAGQPTVASTTSISL